jgi:hypothetical protein
MTSPTRLAVRCSSTARSLGLTQRARPAAGGSISSPFRRPSRCGLMDSAPGGCQVVMLVGHGPSHRVSWEIDHDTHRSVRHSPTRG